MATDFTNQVILVTGASSGIGKGAALAFARQQARVAILSIEKEKLRQVAVESGMEEQFFPVAADISDPVQMKSAIDKIVQHWGQIDHVFANAGINGVWAPLDELKVEDWDRTINVNLRGTFLTVKFALPHLRKNGGSVVITSSVNGTRMFSNTGATAYACTKAAQAAMAKMLALELAPVGIRVNVICPGSIQTEIDRSTEKRDLESVSPAVKFPKGKVPLTHGKPGSAEEVADLVLFLCSDAARHISGTEVWIDGAQSLLQG